MKCVPRAHHQQIAVLFFGELDDRGLGRALLQHGVDHAGVARRQLSRQFGQRAFGLSEQLELDPGCVAAEQTAQIVQRGATDHVCQREPGAGMGFGELRGTFQGMPRRRGKIGGGEQRFGPGHGDFPVRRASRAENVRA